WSERYDRRPQIPLDGWVRAMDARWFGLQGGTGTSPLNTNSRSSTVTDAYGRGDPDRSRAPVRSCPGPRTARPRRSAVVHPDWHRLPDDLPLRTVDVRSRRFDRDQPRSDGGQLLVPHRLQADRPSAGAEPPCPG